MNKKITLLFLQILFVSTQVISAQQIYTNGPLSTGGSSASGVTAPAGYTWSEVQSDTGNTTESNTSFGYSSFYLADGSTSFVIADDFVVPVGETWNVTSFDFFIYQTGFAGTVPPIDELRVIVYSGNPSAGGTVFAGNLTTNVYDAANSADALIYRTGNSVTPAPGTTPGTTRKVWRVRGSLTTSLPAGTYWVGFQGHATNNAAFFSPPVTVPGTRGLPAWNAQQLTVPTTTWSNVIDGGNPATAPDVPQATAFVVNGTIVLSPPANDTCTTAFTAAALPYTNVQTNGALATNNAGFINVCPSFGGMNDGIWYSFVGDGTDIVVAVSNVDLTFDPQLDVYTGTCGAFTCAGSSDISEVGGGDETVTVTTTLGTVYYVNIGHWSTFTEGPEGNFTINITPGLANSTFTNGDFKAYPNPVKDVLNLSYTQEISNVEVYNILGQQVITKTINANQSQVDMSQLGSGTYLVKVFADNETQTIKVVKE